MDRLLGEIDQELQSILPNATKRWRKHNHLKAHVNLLDRAVERFLAKDYMSCSSILYPRIEGILRSMAKSIGEEYSQKKLAATPKQLLGDQANIYTRMLPDKFQEYLEKVYFKNFNPEKPEAISRNTIGHGVAPQEFFNKKSSCIGFLIIEQLYLLIPSNYNEN